MGIAHTYYKCTQSNRLEKKNYAYKIACINLQSKLCNKNKHENELIKYTQFKGAIIII